MSQRPPTLHPAAAERWRRRDLPTASPWLHEEIGRRMEERLQWITRAPQRWAHWYALQGGLEAHALVARRFAQAGVTVVEATERNAAAVAAALAKPWWTAARWRSGAAQVLAQPEQPEPGSADMVWANMALHFAADPEALIADWHRALASDGYLMFSCLGPDTLAELRAVYASEGWPPPGPAFTDMHDWGDMLVHAGFAEPVMDMERIVLTYDTPQRLLRELRETGRNLHPARFTALRGRGFADRLAQALADATALRGDDGNIAVTIEVVYGHAFKPQPRMRLAAESTVSLKDMRGMLRRGAGGSR